MKERILRSLNKHESEVITRALQDLAARNDRNLSQSADIMLEQKMNENLFWYSERA